MIIKNVKELAAAIDHATLKPEVTGEQIRRLCEEAKQYGFISAFVNPRWVPMAADLLHGSKVAVGTVVSFPFGTDSTKIKVLQAKEAIFDGADEIDMVADIAAIIEGDETYLAQELETVLKVCRSMKPKVLLKVIIEAAALTREQKIFACQIADKVGVNFVKTSTGFHPAGGATVEDIKIMREHAGYCKVKASGGIRTAKQALELLEAGAERLGTSSGVQIIEQFEAGQIKMTIAAPSIERKTTVCRLQYRKINSEINLASLSEAFSALPNVSILGANSSKETADGFSYWMAWPKEVFEFRAGQVEPFEKLNKILNLDSRFRGNDKGLPKGIFTGGWVGFFGYELGGYLEPVRQKSDDLQLPLIRLCFYDRLIAYDHSEKSFWLIALELDDDAETPQQKLSLLENLLDKARTTHVPTPSPADMENISFEQIRSNMDSDYYFKMFEKIKRHIYDGDVYQVNFSQRFECDYHARTIDLFHWQNRYNPSPYSAYIDAGNFKIVSASPEMFITADNRIISTRPIKGTRKRLEETSAEIKQTNAENRQQLLDSAKEKAELNMIIDLERNDVARICKPGTRTVSQPRTIETCPTVFHAVATVSGELRDDVNFRDILKAMFPGGSITGAPKIRAMQIIDEIEPTARGIYTGSIGYIGLDGRICLNIAIRTIIIKNKSAYVQTGGGIVADSDPKAEWNETLIKARALLAGIKAVNS